MEPSGLAIRRYRPGDEQRIGDAFRLANADGDTHAATRKLAHWRWQFADNPAGQHVVLAIDADGAVAASIAAVPQVADTVFGPRRFACVVDPVTHPAYRRDLRRAGVAALLRHALGTDCRERGIDLGYGVTSRAGERIGRRVFACETLTTLDHLLRPTTAAALSTPAGVDVERLLVLPEELDILWTRCLPGNPCAVRRDHRYLHWRYERCPHRRVYEFHGAFRRDRLVGLLVLRPFHDLVPGACTIADLVVDDADDDTAAALLARADDRARQCSRRWVLALAAGTAPDRRRMSTAGFAPAGAAGERRRLLYRIDSPRIASEYLRAHWRYTLGDTDLV